MGASNVLLFQSEKVFATLVNWLYYQFLLLAFTMTHQGEYPSFIYFKPKNHNHYFSIADYNIAKEKLFIMMER